MDIRHLLNQDLTIYRPTATSDGAGRYVDTFAKIGATRGRLSAVSSSERKRAARDEQEYTDVLYLHGGTDVQRGDHVKRNADGSRVLVQQVRTLSLTSHMEVEVQRVERGPGVQELPGD